MYSELTRPVGAARSDRDECREAVVAARNATESTSLAYVRPKQTLGRSALLSGAFSLLPVFAALLWLTHDTGSWPVVVFGEVVVTALFFVVYIRFKLVFAAVTATHVVKQRMVLSTSVVDRSRIDRLLVHRVYRGGSTEALTQLLAVDPMGRRVFAMNALFWADSDIARISDALGVQTTVDPTPMSRADYYREFPTARGWYVRRPALSAFVVAGLGIVAGLTVLLRDALSQ